MVSLSDIFKNIKFATRQNEQPQITPLQMKQDGSIDHAASLALKNDTLPLTLGERLTGRTFTEDYQETNPKTGETKLETVTNYRPGLLNDISGGYRENRFTPISLNNFGQNTLDDGRDKGFAYRFGEGLGSLAKFAESPLGRSLLVGGIVGATGGSGLEALAYGGTAGMLNQANRSADKIYRDDLIQSQQNALRNSPEFKALSSDEQKAQLQGIADNIYSQPGYINKDIYSNLINTQQIRDNADWKRLYFDTQQENNRLARDLSREKFEYQKGQDAIQNALARKKIEQDAAKSPISFSNISSMRQEFSRIPAIKTAGEIQRQFNIVDSIYQQYKAGKLRANAADQAMVTTLNKILDPTSVVRESEFDRTAQGQALMQKIQGYANKINKGGSGLTDKERDDLYNSMKIMLNASMTEAQNYIDSYTDLANRYGINPADIMPRQYLPSKTNNNVQNERGSLVRVQAPDGKVHLIPQGQVSAALQAGGKLI